MQSMTELKQAALTRYLTETGLNPPQQEAVRTVSGPVCVLAGAGSGKTTAIVSRIAFMMRFGDVFDRETPPCTPEEMQYLADTASGAVSPDPDRLAAILGYAPIPGWRILAITFTNKAAAELKSRLAAMLGDSAGDVWAATFHSACVRILRRYIDRLGYDKSFTIYDADDTKRVLTAIVKEPPFPGEHGRSASLEKAFPPKIVAHEISAAKDRLLTPESLEAQAEGDYRKTVIARIYGAYQKRLRESNAVDFDDIIALTVQLFTTCPDVLEHYQNQCRYLLVDEYQDTNPAQYELIRLLSERNRNLCVVGDDDQSIYKFRGATIENILSFESQFPDAKVIRLEQNYRSTGRILQAANSVIRNNASRKSKTLWTAAGDGEKVLWYRAQDQNDEADFVTETVRRGAENGGKYSEYAVLYRTHALSNTIERKLTNAGIPYRIYGGLRFFERREIKDVVAYLSVIDNPGDTLRFSRIINLPKRGIGAQTLNQILSISQDLGITPLEVLRTAESYPLLRSKLSAIRAASEMFDFLIDAAETMEPDQLYETVLERTGYLEMLKEEGEEGESRIENIEELKSNIATYMNSAESEGEEPTLSGFLEEISLYTDQDRTDESADAVTLMTVHAAKGLEYGEVFLIGMEDGIFPGTRSMDSEDELEEERRLAYVAITRAKRRLYVISTSFRMLHGQTVRFPVSRFLREMEPDVIEEKGVSFFGSGSGSGTAPKSSSIRVGNERIGVPYLRAAAAQPAAAGGQRYSPGERIRHPVHGEGTVLTVTPMGGDTMLEIAFDRAGTKRIMTNYTKIRKV